MELLRKAYAGMKWEHSKASSDEMLCLEDFFGFERTRTTMHVEDVVACRIDF